MRAELQRGYVLHTRPHGDTSLIVTCLTREFGKISLIAKGVRQKRVKTRQYLQMFTPLLLSWQGKSNLKTLTHSEYCQLPVTLESNYLYSAFYINELLVKLLPENDEHKYIFDAYEEVLNGLNNAVDLEPLLRLFELTFIECLGYGIRFNSDTEGHPIQADSNYTFYSENGFSLSNKSVSMNNFSGLDILRISQFDFSDKAVRASAKRLTRMALKPLLGSRKLESRELFRSMVSTDLSSPRET